MYLHHAGELPLPSAATPGLVDNHGRRITYLRLAITDRCNLRCRYCMPEGGVDFVPHHEILSFEELERLVRLLAALGVSKVRITGGEPLVRHDCLALLKALKEIDAVRSLHITTNGVVTAGFLDQLMDLGLAGLNLSLDTLDRQRFWRISRRDFLPRVLSTLEGCLARRLALKINSVVLDDTSDEEILSLTAIARQHPVSVRFIEKMPFSGRRGAGISVRLPLRERLLALFPEQLPLAAETPTTACLYAIPGFAGTIGIIEGNSRRFCATCNKLRITPRGMLKACLYDNGVLDLRAMLRGGASDSEIQQAITACVHNRFANGHETQAFCQRETEQSMAGIGG